MKTKIKKQHFEFESKHKNLGSIEDASILRKFSVLFLVMSILPLLVLFYLYMQLLTTGKITISLLQFQMTLMFTVLGIALGYDTTRRLFKSVVDLTAANKKALESVLDNETLYEINQGENEISVLSKSFAAVTDRLEENVKKLDEARKTLHAVMQKVGKGISNMDNIDTFLELILETMTNALNADVSCIMMYDKQTNELYGKTIFGTESSEFKNYRIIVKKNSPLSQIQQSKKLMIIEDNLDAPHSLKGQKPFFVYPMICTPLVYRDKFSGVVIVGGGEISENIGDQDRSLVYNLASQTAVAIDNSTLNTDIEKTYFETISALALAVDVKDKFSRGHLDRVGVYCTMIGKQLGLDDEDIKTLQSAARLHDLGKIGIPDDVLSKKGPLSDEEWLLMRKHPEIGESIIKPIRSLNNLCDIIRHHHEKLDGSGYPDGLKGEEIAPLVRIIGIADIYDALTSDRSYRQRLSAKESAQILRSMDKQLDQDIVEIFLETIVFDMESK
ncbi:MAG: HD domain-containing protein [Candidatus Omnitrophica bacterium]|nr:HD domain-containing protein [Candidatus Omnitrophota bacterium]MBU4333101.1 HD domain-containing protein [Candidatus Omnitrophota bacterium]